MYEIGYHLFLLPVPERSRRIGGVAEERRVAVLFSSPQTPKGAHTSRFKILL